MKRSRSEEQYTISLSRAGFLRLTSGLVKVESGKRLLGVRQRFDHAINAALDAEAQSN